MLYQRLAPNQKRVAPFFFSYLSEWISTSQILVESVVEKCYEFTEINAGSRNLQGTGLSQMLDQSTCRKKKIHLRLYGIQENRTEHKHVKQEIECTHPNI